MKLFLVLTVVVALVLSACAGPNGTAGGTHRGGTASTDIFKIHLP